MSSLWYVSLGCCAAAPSPTATSKASCRTRMRDVQLTGVAETPQSLSSKIWQFGYSSFWKIIHHVAESTDRISREISSPYLKYSHSQSEPALQYTLFFVCCVIPRQRRIWCHVATQQVKKHILGASVGPQLLHGRGLCNFWAKINSAGGEVDAGRHVLNAKCVWTHVVISAIAKCWYSTLNVHQFSWFSKSRDQHLWYTGLTSEIWMVTNLKWHILVLMCWSLWFPGSWTLTNSGSQRIPVYCGAFHKIEITYQRSERDMVQAHLSVVSQLMAINANKHPDRPTIHRDLRRVPKK